MSEGGREGSRRIEWPRVVPVPSLCFADFVCSHAVMVTVTGKQLSVTVTTSPPNTTRDTRHATCDTRVPLLWRCGGVVLLCWLSCLRSSLCCAVVVKVLVVMGREVHETQNADVRCGLDIQAMSRRSLNTCTCTEATASCGTREKDGDNHTICHCRNRKAIR